MRQPAPVGRLFLCRREAGMLGISADLTRCGDHTGTIASRSADDSHSRWSIEFAADGTYLPWCQVLGVRP